MKFFIIANVIISAVLTVCYSYQMIYTVIACLKKPKRFEANSKGRFAVLAAARNEEAVIKQFVDSVKNQNYPSGLVDIYIVADNCDDKTSAIARNAGAVVFERFDKINIVKATAMDLVLQGFFE